MTLLRNLGVPFFPQMFYEERLGEGDYAMLIVRLQSLVFRLLLRRSHAKAFSLEVHLDFQTQQRYGWRLTMLVHSGSRQV
jgi:hypothetical protein